MVQMPKGTINKSPPVGELNTLDVINPRLLVARRNGLIIHY